MRPNDATRDAERDILHLSKWNRRVMRLLWIFFVVLVSLEAAITITYRMGVTLDYEVGFAYYFLWFFVRPCLIVFVTVLTTQLIFSFSKGRVTQSFMARFLLCALIVTMSEIVAFHYGLSVIFVIYVVPIIVSIIYVDTKTVFLTFILSMAAYTFTYFAYVRNFVPDSEYRHTYMDILGTYGIIAITYMLARIVLERVRELINAAVASTLRERELSVEVTKDSLTQLYNHATFYDKLDEFILRHKREGKSFGVQIIDIDDFKPINDTYGHDMGNTVILGLVDVINENLGVGDIAFRYGGEEFTVITSDPSRAVKQAENIRRQISERSFDGVNGNVTVSIGVCSYDDSFGGRREFFSAADKALYNAKETGKNKVKVCE